MVNKNPYVGFRKDRRRINSLWEKFNTGTMDLGLLEDPYVRLLVSEWKRCAKLGVDPTRKMGVKCGEDEFERHLRDNEPLLSIARPIIEKVTGQLAGVPGIVLLADRGGVLLHVAGDRWIRDMAANRSGVIEGSCWLESVAGSNGMGSALGKRQSVHVYSSEHFCEGWHTWTCAATPLLDPDTGETLGVVDFTTIDKDYRDEALALTSSMSEAIGKGLQLDASAVRGQLLRRYEDLSARYRAERIILLDQSGRLVKDGRSGADAVPTAEALRLGADAIPITLPGNGRQVGTAYVVSQPLRARPAARRPLPRSEVPPRSEPRTEPPAAEAHGPAPARAAGVDPQYHKLLEDAADYQVIFDNAIVGICYSVNRRIVRCNRRFEEMLGYEPGALDDRPFAEIYPGARDYRQASRAIFRQFLTHRLYADERVMRRKDGSLFWCAVSGKRLDAGKHSRRAIWILQDISVRKNAEEALQRAHDRLEALVEERTLKVRQKNNALRQEIARRKQTEQKLRESQKKYRILFETSPVGMMVTSKKGEVVEVNKAMARMLGKSELSSYIQGRKGRKVALVHPDGSAMARSELPDARATREGRTVPEFELGMRSAKGAMRWFSVTGAPLPVGDLGAVVAHRDITETKRLEEQDRLRRMELAHISRVNTMGEMAAAMAHELGQPLSSAVNFLSGCRLRMADGDYDRESVAEIISQALYYTERAGDIIKHIRQFIRRHEPNTTSCDLNEVVRDIVRFMDIERRQHCAQIVTQLDPDLPPMMLDPLEINQMIVNFVKNGLEAMAAIPQRRRVLTITTRRKGRKWVLVTVKDRGPGIPPDHAREIFNPFFSTKANGLGLGLVICRSISESHGGKLSVSSGPRRGAAFTVALPLAAG
ncbi:MAG: PAS domain S-box protein [Nevskia sp.]|nr:PAS domain S-box protein [Nevskia sp.]